MKKRLPLAVTVMGFVLGSSSAYAQSDQTKNGVAQSRSGLDRTVNGRDNGNVKEADAGAAQARQGAANSGGNKEAAENARQAAAAAKEAHERHDAPSPSQSHSPTPQAAHKGGGGRN